MSNVSLGARADCYIVKYKSGEAISGSEELSAKLSDKTSKVRQNKNKNYDVLMIIMLFMILPSFPDELHGTTLAGIMAAIMDNDKGIAGVAPAVKIMPIKAFSNGAAYTSDIIETIDYAAINGAKIVNCSWGVSGANQALEDAMAGKNMLFVAAAGNGGKNIDINYVSPASFTIPNLITVASLNKSGTLSPFSNYGTNSADTAAPGEEIVSTSPGNGYVICNGTSMSAAFVSGIAALLLEQHLYNHQDI